MSDFFQDLQDDYDIISEFYDFSITIVPLQKKDVPLIQNAADVCFMLRNEICSDLFRDQSENFAGMSRNSKESRHAVRNSEKNKMLHSKLVESKKNCYSIRSSRYFRIKRRGSGRPCLQVCGPEPMVASLTKAVEALSPTSRKMLDYEVWSFAF